MKTKKTPLILIIIAIIITIGSYREVLFVSLNNQIAFLQGGLKQNYLVDHLKFLENFSQSFLVGLKWFFTITYTLMYYLIGRYSIKNIFGSKEGVKWFGIIYLVFMFIAGISYAFGSFTGSFHGTYSFSRSIMGALQSPIPLLIFIPVLLLKKELNKG